MTPFPDENDTNWDVAAPPAVWRVGVYDSTVGRQRFWTVAANRKLSRNGLRGEFQGIASMLLEGFATDPCAKA
jgi:hypothetical protein